MSLSSKLFKLASNKKAEIWEPNSLDDLLQTIHEISDISSSDDSLVLYRGQTNIAWPIDSTFLRNSILKIFGIEDYNDLPASVRKRVTFHRSIASLLLMKFDQIIKPSKEAYEKEQTHDIDPLFELLKHLQQYPENYEEVPFIKGTNLIDWTYNHKIALYFSTISGVGANKAVSIGDGVLYIFIASETGEIHQNIKTQQLFNNMVSHEYLDGKLGLPLMLHPQKQTNQIRSTNQRPVYIAQMNFSFPVEEIWQQYEKEMNKKLFLKIKINEQLKLEINGYLQSNEITEDYVYPH
jgi:hypothetical protein